MVPYLCDGREELPERPRWQGRPGSLFPKLSHPLQELGGPQVQIGRLRAMPLSLFKNLGQGFLCEAKASELKDLLGLDEDLVPGDKMELKGEQRRDDDPVVRCFLL